MDNTDKQRYLALNIEDFTKELLGVNLDPVFGYDCCNKKNSCGLMESDGLCPFGADPFGTSYNADVLDELDYIRNRQKGRTLIEQCLLEEHMRIVLEKYEPYLKCKGRYEEASKHFEDIIEFKDAIEKEDDYTLQPVQDTSAVSPTQPQSHPISDMLNIDEIRQKWEWACILIDGKDVDLGQGTYASMRDPQQIENGNHIIADLYEMIKPYEQRIKVEASGNYVSQDIQLLNGICRTYHKDVEYLIPVKTSTQHKDGNNSKPHYNNDNKAQATTQYNGTDEVKLPDELNTPTAQKAFANAIKQGLIERTETGYKWTNNKPCQLAYFLYLVYCPTQQEEYKETAFNKLFGKTRLLASLTQVLNAKQPQRWRQDIERLLE